ncbi:c-type cytochrome [Pseudoroseicyclus sp. H15]
MRFAFTALILASLPLAASAQDAPETLAGMMANAPPGGLACTGCHGVTEDAPLSLAQMAPEDIEAAMAHFRAGEREGTIMPRIAPGFSPDEVAAIAAWITGVSE